jgi:hypothetical protein
MFVDLLDMPYHIGDSRLIGIEVEVLKEIFHLLTKA